MIPRITRSRSGTPHVDDLALSTEPPSADAPAAASPAKVDAAAEAEAERAAFLAATAGFAFEGPLIVVRSGRVMICSQRQCMLWPVTPEPA